MMLINLVSFDNQTICDLKLIVRKMIKDLIDPTVPICRAIGIISSEEVRLMVRRSKYYVVPRFLRYRQY